MALLEYRSIPLLEPARDLLRRFAASWVAGALKALPRGAPDAESAGVLLVDGFAGADYPVGSERLPGLAAAAMGLVGRERTGGRVSLLMLEEDPAKLDWLAAVFRQLTPGEPIHMEGELQAGLNLRSGTLDALEPAAGEIGRSRRSLLVVDPPRAGALPMELLNGWLGVSSADLLLRFPSSDLRRLERYRGQALADLPPHGKRLVEGVSRLLGDARHDWLHCWVPALEIGLEDGVGAVVNRYADRLRRDGLVVRRVLITESGGGEHLFLLTRDPASVLLLNRVVHGLREEGVLPWPAGSAGAVCYAPLDELALFGRGDTPPCRCQRVVDRSLLADGIAKRFAGRAVRLDEILLCHVDTDLFVDDLRRALLDLRRDARALFHSLGGDAEITFPAVEARAMHRPPTRKRPARSQELTLELG